MDEDDWGGGAEWHLGTLSRPECRVHFPLPSGNTPQARRGRASKKILLMAAYTFFNDGIIEKLVRAGLRARVAGNGTKSGSGNGG